MKPEHMTMEELLQYAPDNTTDPYAIELVKACENLMRELEVREESDDHR